MGTPSADRRTVGVSEDSRYDKSRRRGLGVTADANIDTTVMQKKRSVGTPESYSTKPGDIYFLGGQGVLDYCTLRFVLHLTHDAVFHGRDKQMNGSIHSSSLGLPKSRRLTELEPLQTVW